MSKKHEVQKAGLPKTYKTVLEIIKERIKSVQLKAAISVNHELILLFFNRAGYSSVSEKGIMGKFGGGIVIY